MGNSEFACRGEMNRTSVRRDEHCCWETYYFKLARSSFPREDFRFRILTADDTNEGSSIRLFKGTPRINPDTDSKWSLTADSTIVLVMLLTIAPSNMSPRQFSAAVQRNIKVLTTKYPANVQNGGTVVQKRR
jgi:hypothetical protein